MFPDEIEIERYSPQDMDDWDRFVRSNSDGIFLFERGFMEYHSDRFEDCSLVARKSGKIVGIFPANIVADTLFSHQGLTYGGWVFSRSVKTTTSIEILRKFLEYTKENISCEKLIYKSMPEVFRGSCSQSDLYFLFQNGGSLVRRDIASVRVLDRDPVLDSGRKDNIRKSKKGDIAFDYSEDYDAFYEILSEVLLRHAARATHSLEELKLLSARFPDRIKLVGAFKDGKMLSGAVLFLFDRVVHTQYLASSVEGRQWGALDGLLAWVGKAYEATHTHLSFGTSTESEGRVLNQGLADQKDGHGGRGVVHDFYELKVA